MLRISDITIKKIIAGEFEAELPEVYELKRNIEHCPPWHVHDSTFNHTLSDLKHLEDIMRLASPKIKSYLNERIGKHTKGELLILVALFHDISKIDIIPEGGLYPQHEEKGSIKVRRILERFNISETEKEYVARNIRYHGIIHRLLAKEGFSWERIEEFKREYSQILPELILFGMADLEGGQMRKEDPKQFRFRMGIFKKILKNSLIVEDKK